MKLVKLIIFVFTFLIFNSFQVPLTEDEVKQGLENTEQEIKDALAGAENYVESILPESIQGKKCMKDTDCSPISYCDGKLDLIV